MTTTTVTQQQIDQLVPVGSWSVDPVHSTAGFEVEHNGISIFRGGFDDISVDLVAGEDGISLTGAARVESIDVRQSEQLRAHLLSPEFFDAERHPEIRFEASDLRIEDGHVVVHGDLTVKGTTKPVEARGSLRGPVVGPDRSERIAVDLETVVDRTEFGLGWNMELPDGRKVLGEDVTLVVHLELVKA
jgi:polyisoprenoid-binding protein YceI